MTVPDQPKRSLLARGPLFVLIGMVAVTCYSVGWCAGSLSRAAGWCATAVRIGWHDARKDRSSSG